jgi:hypothetical protein
MMMRFMVLLSLTAVSLGAQPIVAVAQEVPTFDVSRTCRAESAALPDAARTCVADEQQARGVLVAQWNQFTSESKTSCLQEATGIAGVRSYVELLTCLQTAKDAKGLPNP